MHRICTVDGCENEAIFDTNICDPCLQKACKQSEENFGGAERWICGHCGRDFDPYDPNHLEKHILDNTYVCKAND